MVDTADNFFWWWKLCFQGYKTYKNKFLFRLKNMSYTKCLSVVSFHCQRKYTYLRSQTHVWYYKIFPEHFFVMLYVLRFIRHSSEHKMYTVGSCKNRLFYAILDYYNKKKPAFHGCEWDYLFQMPKLLVLTNVASIRSSFPVIFGSKLLQHLYSVLQAVSIS